MDQPGFERVAILGVGLIGGSLGLALRARGLAGRVTAYSRTADTRRRAVELGAADAAADSPEACVAGADLVYLATPVDAIAPSLAQVAAHLAPGCLVTDAGSSKAALVAAAEAACPPGCHFVGGHPMTGREQMGVEFARADLFEQMAYAITPSAASDPAAVARLTALATALGARPVVLSPADHDQAVAAISHLPHLLAAALVLNTESRAAEGQAVWELAAGSLGCGTRVAAGGSALWRQILVSNRDAVVAAVSQYQMLLDRLATRLAEGDGDGLEQLLEDARRVRAARPARICPP
jgi:prephenate dehydrogenase